MTAAQQPKKSETLEIRLPYATKTAFMARCRADGRTASEALRGFIERDVTRDPAPASKRRALGWPAGVAAAVGLAVGALAAPTLAQTATSREAFDRLDRNRDGVLTFREFGRP